MYLCTCTKYLFKCKIAWIGLEVCIRVPGRLKTFLRVLVSTVGKLSVLNYTGDLFLIHERSARLLSTVCSKSTSPAALVACSVTLSAPNTVISADMRRPTGGLRLLKGTSRTPLAGSRVTSSGVVSRVSTSPIGQSSPVVVGATVVVSKNDNR